MLEEVINTLDKAARLDEVKAFRFAVDSDVKTLIKDLNTKNQLGELGIDADGDSLGEYAPFTVQKKLTEGQGIGRIVDHITFYETGDYWKSWVVTANGQEITITTDTEKFNELVNDLGFAPEHVGLTDANLNKVTALMLVKYQQFARKQMGF